MKQKILKWVYDESSNAYDLYFTPYNDSEPEAPDYCPFCGKAILWEDKQ